MTEELTRPTEKELQAEIQASLLNTLELLNTKFESKSLLKSAFLPDGENIQYGCFNATTKTL